MNAINASRATPDAGVKPGRLVSLDAYRGAIMLFLLSAGFGFKEVARQFPESGFWTFLGHHTEHVTWLGGSAWDMIQPAFMLMVGMAMPFSYGRRAAEGETFARQFRHVLWRSLVLVLLALVISTKPGASRTTFMFTNVLAQIGLGYPLLFLISLAPVRAQWLVVFGAAIATWLAFVLHPLPPPGFNYGSVGVRPALLGAATLPGFFAHWNMGTNFGAEFDRWFLNLFPTEKPFEFNPGGYVTLNFVPSLITMALGVLTGARLRRQDGAAAKLRWLLVVAGGCIIAGWAAGQTVCPIVKRIWTPSWSFFSGGIVLLLLAALFYVVELRGWKRWTVPLAAVGMNSIAAYLMDIFIRDGVTAKLHSHLDVYISGPYAAIFFRTVTLLLLWGVLGWMYRKRIFLKI